MQTKTEKHAEYIKHRDKYIARAKKRYAAKRKEILAQEKDRYASNKPAKVAYARKYSERIKLTNPEKYLEWNTAAQTNRRLSPKRKAYEHRYNLEHKEQKAAHCARRRALEYKVNQEVLPRKEVHAKTSGKCLYCGKTIGVSEMHTDHYIPLSLAVTASDRLRRIIGSTTNLVPACVSCNTAKNDRLPLDFIWSRA